MTAREYRRIGPAVKASAEKRTREGVLYMDCAVCGKEMRVWRSRLKRAKLPVTCGKECRAEVMRGPSNPRWKGGAWISSKTGYRHVAAAHLADEDLALLPTPTPREVPEHRLVMARVLGRWPAPHEHVHHVDGDKANNAPENLRLMDWKAHSREHRATLRRLAVLGAENATLRDVLARR